MLPEDFRIRLEALEKAPRIIDRDIPLEWLSSEFKNCEFEVTPLVAHCRVRVQAVSPGVLVRGTAFAEINTPCSTCLEDVLLHLETEIDAYLMPLATDAEQLDDAEFTPEDLQREWFEGDVIDLTDLIRDGLMLELPMTPRCSGSCRQINGLITAEEAAKREQKIDPRLAALADIRLSKES